MPAEGALRDGTPASLELIETLRWEPDEGFLRLERHLARLQDSARELGFACDRTAVRAALAGAVSDAEAMRRVRLTMAADGRAQATAQGFSLQPDETIWRLKLAETQLCSGDALLRHKTTRRDAYDRARSEFPLAEADEVLLLNEREEACEGTITSLFVDFGDGGVLRTPALSCGLLAGVLRGEMLETGAAVEAVLTTDNLRAAKALFVGNSLRGLIRAKLV
ncbi:aminotransferase class IV family protein [Mesorhizobium sp. 10J20-29]